MSEYIEREVAINYLIKNMTYEADEEEKESAIRELIRGIPSADVVSADCALTWEQLKRLWRLATSDGGR